MAHYLNGHDCSLPGGALQYLTKWKLTSLGFIQPRISQVLRVHKDLLLDLFSSSAVQMENHSSQFEPKMSYIVWTQLNSLPGHEQGRVESQSAGQLRWIVPQGVSPKTIFDFYNDFKLHQSSPSGSDFKFFGAKRMLLQAPETHLNCY